MTVQHLRRDMSNAEFIDWQVYTRRENARKKAEHAKAMQEAKRRH